MNIIDHLSVGVPGLPVAREFYDGLLAQLDIRCLAADAGFAAYGRGVVQFVLITPQDHGPQSAGNGVHVCFAAPSRESVDAFHRFALDNGGTDEGAPGPRAAYPIPDVYCAFVRDPFGNKLEAIHNGFAGAG